MRTKLIAYQLEDYDHDYAQISAYLKRRPGYLKVMDRVWIIKTTKTTPQIRTALSELNISQAKILVVDITDSVWSTFGVSQDKVQWLKDFVR